jgi:hypothetical protein
MEKIAMKCTRAEYEGIRDFIGDLDFISTDDFYKYNYLINNHIITNNCYIGHSKPERKVYETFDKAIFLKACGIKVKKDKRKKMFKKTIKLLKSFDELNFDIQSIDTEYGTDGFFKITIIGNKTK